MPGQKQVTVPSSGASHKFDDGALCGRWWYAIDNCVVYSEERGI